MRRWRRRRLSLSALEPRAFRCWDLWFRIAFTILGGVVAFAAGMKAAGDTAAAHRYTDRLKAISGGPPLERLGWTWRLHREDRQFWDATLRGPRP